MYDINTFSSKDMISCGKELRNIFNNASDIIDALQKTSEFFFDSFYDKDNPAFVLSRFFKTHQYKKLPNHLQQFADNLAGKKLDENIKCLTLLGTKGIEKEWNALKDSTGHQAIPLVSVEFIEEIPMMSGLITQFGISIKDFIAYSETFVGNKEREFHIFFVEKATGSPIISAQEKFVIPYGVNSVVGFGGPLPDGNCFTGILFSKTPMVRKTAELFQPLAINIKKGLLNFFEDDLSAKL